MSFETASDPTIKANLEPFLLVLSISLGVATLARIFPLFRQIPYTLLLVIVGLSLSFVDVHFVNLSPELILEIFLPILLFEAAWNVRWRDLRANWFPIFCFAVFGIVISTFGVASALDRLTSISLPAALLIGASLATTDPVSVVALLREVGAGKRLTVLMEGESLFNDGVGVVLFGLLVAIPMGTEEFSASGILTRFGTFVGIGVGIGCLVGFGLSYLTQRFDLPLVEQSLTLVAAYGAYLLTEELGGSGVIGVVLTGLILGNFGSNFGMNPKTRLYVSDFWEFLAFFVNSIVFLVIGDQIRFFPLLDNLPLICVSTIALLVTRFLTIFSFGSLSEHLTGDEIGLGDRTVLWWGGLRGSVSIALALSIPVAVTERQDIIDTVFGVVLFSLLGQGLTMQWLMQKLNLIGDRPLRQAFSELLARRIALTRVLHHLERIEPTLTLDPEQYRYEKELIVGEMKSIEDKLAKLKIEYPQMRSLEIEHLRETLLDIEADTYAELIRAGQLNTNLSPILQGITSKSELRKT